MIKFLCTLIAITCLVGCSTSETPRVVANSERIEDVLGRIDKNISDTTRAEQMRQIVTQLGSRLKAHETSLNSKRGIIIAASAEYTTTRSDLQALYAEAHTEMREMMGEVKSAHFKMKEIATPEEWKAVAGGKKQLIEFN